MVQVNEQVVTMQTRAVDLHLASCYLSFIPLHCLCQNQDKIPQNKS